MAEPKKGRFKAVKLSVEVYNELPKARKLAIKKARQSKNDDLVRALKAMGIGAVAGWLILKAIKDLGLEKSE